MQEKGDSPAGYAAAILYVTSPRRIQSGQGCCLGFEVHPGARQGGIESASVPVAPVRWVAEQIGLNGAGDMIDKLCKLVNEKNVVLGEFAVLCARCV